MSVYLPAIDRGFKCSWPLTQNPVQGIYPNHKDGYKH